MGFLLALALAAAAPPTPPTPPTPGTADEAGAVRDASVPTLLVLSLDTAGVSADEASILDGMIANALTGRDDIEVVTAEELRQMIELEGEKQALGCDDTSCLGEIAGAMGAQYVLFGKVGRLGELTVVQVNLFDSTAAKTVTRQEIKEQGIELVAEQIQPAVDSIVAHLMGAPVVERPTPVAATTVETGGVSPLLLAGGGVAAAGLLATMGSAAVFGVFLSQLGAPKSLSAEKTTAATFAPWTLVGVGVGGAILLAGVGVAGAGLVLE